MYIYVYIYIYIHIYSISYKQGLNVGASEEEADKICFILRTLSLYFCLLILLCLQSAALYK